MITVRELRNRRAEKIDAAAKLNDLAELEDRNFTEAEQTEYDTLLADAEALEARAKRLEDMSGIKQVLDARQAPVHNKIKAGDTEERAWAHWVRTGDDGGIREYRASNDTTMNITTDADGGYAVPTGHYQGIIARRDEAMLANQLGVRMIPGKGTTVNVPIDDEADGEFVSTAESNAYDRDAPALSVKAMTLTKYTKKVDLTVELLEDEDSRIISFLNDFVGRGMAKTHNSLLLTEVAANGTALKTFASATVIAVDELEPIVFNEALGNYLDDGGSVAWVMQRAVHGEIVLLDDANTRRYAHNTMPDANGRFTPSLLGFPVKYSAKSGATAASTKSLYFGNWNYVGYREAPGFTVIRDPYSRAAYGEIIFHYMFRAVYGVLQAEAIGFGVHPSA